MQEYNEMMEQYQELLKQAVTMDERGEDAKADGRRSEAAEYYGTASQLYAAAARVLLQVLEQCDVKDESHFKKSIDRLIGISAQMKDKAAKISQPAQSKESKGKKIMSDEEPTVFLPVSTDPDVHFDDIAGLQDAKQLVLDKIINPLLYQDLYQKFRMRCRGGLLLYGPPGGGKTMMARAIATESNYAFFSVRCSDIVGKYFGEAEKRVRDLFAAARAAKNAVVFLDEAEAIACRRGGNSTVMARLVPELLAQMDGFDEFDGHLIVIFATNRPYDIDPAFLRPGRMAAMCYVPLPDYEVRLKLLTAQFANRPCEADLDLAGLARDTERFSCADLVNLVETCAQKPLNRSISHRQNGEEETEERISNQDIALVKSKVFPSVEEKEVARLEKWTADINGRVCA